MEAYTINQLAERYSVDRGTVLSWIRDGDLRAINVGVKGKQKPRYRVTEEALIEFEQRREIEA